MTWTEGKARKGRTGKPPAKAEGGGLSSREDRSSKAESEGAFEQRRSKAQADDRCGDETPASTGGTRRKERCKGEADAGSSMWIGNRPGSRRRDDRVPAGAFGFRPGLTSQSAAKGPRPERSGWEAETGRVSALPASQRVARRRASAFLEGAPAAEGIGVRSGFSKLRTGSS